MESSDRPYQDIDFMSTVLGELDRPLADLPHLHRAELRQLVRHGLRAHSALGKDSPLLMDPELLDQAKLVHEGLRVLGLQDYQHEASSLQVTSRRVFSEGVSAQL